METFLYFSSYVPNAIALSWQHFLHLALAAETAAVPGSFKNSHIRDFIGSQTPY